MIKSVKCKECNKEMETTCIIGGSKKDGYEIGYFCKHSNITITVKKDEMS